ncbi:hypothetical protein V5799_017540 [Amblyomma americanum]|uniref:Uncharacterized protein n=1 Tax=Amblyomma americanum TaxID=6943 RepID=A0AAQ4F333_AMBAM
MSNKNRVRFGINLDLEFLAYALSESPFQDAMQWTNIASKVQDIAGRSFTVRAVRDRTELLLRHYAANDRASLNKLGTEEQYPEREVLLQEVLDLAREHGVKLRARRKHILPLPQHLARRTAPQQCRILPRKPETHTPRHTSMGAPVTVTIKAKARSRRSTRF